MPIMTLLTSIVENEILSEMEPSCRKSVPVLAHIRQNQGAPTAFSRGRKFMRKFAVLLAKHPNFSISKLSTLGRFEISRLP